MQTVRLPGIISTVLMNGTLNLVGMGTMLLGLQVCEVQLAFVCATRGSRLAWLVVSESRRGMLSLPDASACREITCLWSHP